MIVRRENWNNPELFKAVIIIGIVMTSLGLFNGLFGVGHPQTRHSWGQRCYILMIYRAAQITKLGSFLTFLQISACLKQNAETCIKATSGFKHEERAGPCDDAEDGFTPSLNSIVCSLFHRRLPVWSQSAGGGEEGSSRVIALWQ